MFKLVLSLLVVSIAGCGISQEINGVERKPVGLISMNLNNNLSGNYSRNVQYEVCWGNVIWGVILFETIIGPIYFFGFSMFNPVGPVISDTTSQK